MSRNLAFLFILLTAGLDAIGFGLILPVLPDLIRDVRGSDLSEAALWGGVLATTFAVMQFVFGAMIGSLSDRYGRRPVLLVSLVIMALDYVLMAVAGSIWLLLFGRIIHGITSATHATASAYIADISAPEDKAKNFGLLGAAFGVGFVVGPVIGGLLAEFGTRAPFWFAAALAFANGVFGFIVLPETVTEQIRRPFTWRRANPFGAFSALGRLPGLNRFLLLAFLYEFAFLVYPTIWAYFTQARFGWGPGMIGASLASFGVAMAIVQGGLIRVFLDKLGEIGTIRIGLWLNTTAFLFMGIVVSPTLALIVIPLTALGAVVTPALDAMMSQRTPDSQQGELQGVLSSTRSLAYIFAPLVMTQIFAVFSQEDASMFLPGAPFLVSMLLMGLCILVFAGRSRQHCPPCAAFLSQ